MGLDQEEVKAMREVLLRIARTAADRRHFSIETEMEAYLQSGGVCECTDADCGVGHDERCSAPCRPGAHSGFGVDGGWQFDHVDNDPSNNEPENCQVLCSACHEDKTNRFRDSG